MQVAAQAHPHDGVLFLFDIFLSGRIVVRVNGVGNKVAVAHIALGVPDDDPGAPHNCAAPFYKWVEILVKFPALEKPSNLSQGATCIQEIAHKGKSFLLR